MNTKVVRAIDAFLDANNKIETTPPEVAPYLEKKGILKNSKQRSGKELRVLLRNGQIPNAIQKGNRWVIRRSNFRSPVKIKDTDSNLTHANEVNSKPTVKHQDDTLNTTESFSWQWCQDNSDTILLSGLSILESSSAYSFDHNFTLAFGNYLISDQNENWSYIGESNNLANRIKQHGKLKTSTFYKNYINAKKDHPSLAQDIELHDFRVQYISTNIGRKELEEFGIVNLPSNLNRFQLGKRKSVKGDTNADIWKAIQNQTDQLLKDGTQVIVNLGIVPWNTANPPNRAGIYWIEHPEDGLIYIGESSNLFERYKAHSKTTYFSAFRRNTAEKLLGFTLKEKKGKRKYLSETEEATLDQFISECSIKILPVAFGRFELEEYLIALKKPLLNRKGNSSKLT
ncbi:MAG: GIY-YIG nuclease family protein [Balneolaceae bacterium]|nr:GIY-YIG nuclease family protein [Balneolaceae bacterium]